MIGLCALQACDAAIEDSSERVIDMMVELLKDSTSSIVVTPDQFDKVAMLFIHSFISACTTVSV